MSNSKTIFFLVSFFLFLYIPATDAQVLNINGDTIFVNTKSEVQLIFPSLPTRFITIPDSNQYRIRDTRTGINIAAKSADYHPVTLFITEALRSHRFILMFKNDNAVRLLYDYSTEKKLAQHINETSSSNFVESAKPENKKSKRGGVVDNISNYYSMLEQGDKYVLLEKYQEAKLSYDKAHALRPDEITPVLKLDAIKSRLAEVNKSQPENDKKYLLLTEEAQNKIGEKKYDDAIKIYRIVLDMKPGDEFATQQMKIVSSLLAKENTKIKNQKNNLDQEKIEQAQKQIKNNQLEAQANYDSVVVLADNFFNAADYENAEKEYNKALEFLNKQWPKSQLNKINKVVAQANTDEKKLEEQQSSVESKSIVDSTPTPAQIRQRYNLAVAMGKSSYQKNELLNAKAFYEEALALQPSQQLPKNQLKIINSKIEDSAKAAELDNNYDRFITLADSLVIAKSYDSSIAIYKQASFLKPLETYPQKQVRYIQSQLVLDAKRKKEEREQQHNDAISRGDKAVKENRYDDAKSAYEEALSIHPEDEYAKRRLSIISYQIEKARAEKHVQDSIQAAKQVIPVKKTKRKRSS
jgi:hypothetical protein